MGRRFVRKTNKSKIRYKAQVRLKGHPIQTATFERLTDAKRWVQQTESAIREGRHFKTSEAKKRTFKELIERYEREILPTKPRSKQESQFDWWKKEIGHLTLADVSPTIIAECRDKLSNKLTPQRKKLSSGTVLRYLAALSHAFTIAVQEWQWLENSPMAKVRKPKPSKGRVRFLNEDERNRLLKSCKESQNLYLYTIVVLALSTGMRKNEILSLQWKNIDLATGRITLHETKNNERRTVHLTGAALSLIKQLYEQIGNESDLLFPSSKGQMGQNGQNPLDIRSAWEAAVKRAKINDFKFHDLRHCTASYLAMNGATLFEISQVLGHKTLSMVKRYSHISEDHAADVVQRMNQKIFGVVNE